MDDTTELVQRVLAGDAAAWRELQIAVEPAILRIARRHPSLLRKGLAAQPDDLAEIRTVALENLACANFSNLRRFNERSASAAAPLTVSFDAWLYGLVDFVVREHLRKRFGRASGVMLESASGVRRLNKRELHSQAGRLEDHPEPPMANAFGITTRLTLVEIQQFIDAEFSSQEAQAVRMHYLEGYRYEEIARQLGLGDGASAERLVRRLNARLRYRFAEHAPD